MESKPKDEIEVVGEKPSVAGEELPSTDAEVARLSAAKRKTSGTPEMFLMRAAFIDKFGEAEEIKIGNFYRPSPAPNQIMIAVNAASINPIDWKLRSGSLKLIKKSTFPLILGFDVSGTVVARGKDCKKFKVGDEVYGRLSHTGAFSEFVADVESVFALKPHSINHSDAASVPLVGLTSWQVLVERIKLQRGQSILIHGVCDSSWLWCFSAEP